MAEVLANVPEGFGIVKVEDLAVELSETPELVLIDVRTASERAEKGIIDYENQLAIPLEDFIAQKANRPADKDATIVTYCGSGHRSTMAMTILWSYGFNNVRSMLGGFNAWSGAELPDAEAEAVN